MYFINVKSKKWVEVEEDLDSWNATRKESFFITKLSKTKQPDSIALKRSLTFKHGHLGFEDIEVGKSAFVLMACYETEFHYQITQSYSIAAITKSPVQAEQLRDSCKEPAGIRLSPWAGKNVVRIDVIEIKVQK